MSTGSAKEAHVRPKAGSRGPKGTQRRAKRGPREAHEGPKEPKGAPRRVQGRGAKEGPKEGQGRPQGGPREALSQFSGKSSNSPLLPRKPIMATRTGSALIFFHRLRVCGARVSYVMRVIGVREASCVPCVVNHCRIHADLDTYIFSRSTVDFATPLARSKSDSYSIM